MWSPAPEMRDGTSPSPTAGSHGVRGRRGATLVVARRRCGTGQARPLRRVPHVASGDGVGATLVVARAGDAGRDRPVLRRVPRGVPGRRRGDPCGRQRRRCGTGQARPLRRVPRGVPGRRRGDPCGRPAGDAGRDRPVPCGGLPVACGDGVGATLVVARRRCGKGQARPPRRVPHGVRGRRGGRPRALAGALWAPALNKEAGDDKRRPDGNVRSSRAPSTRKSGAGSGTCASFPSGRPSRTRACSSGGPRGCGPRRSPRSDRRKSRCRPGR